MPSELTGDPGDGGENRVREAVELFLWNEVEKGSFPGASYAVGTSAGIVTAGAIGSAVVDPERIAATTATIYDVASLTKPLITTTLVLKAIAEGRLQLETLVADVLEELSIDDRKGAMTVRHLLTHTSGFQSWFPMYSQGRGSLSYLLTLASRPLTYETGSQVIYSDLGFITLCLILERLYGKAAPALAREKILDPLGLKDALFNPPPELRFRIAATGWGNPTEQSLAADRKVAFDGFRDYMLWGEVNDGNAWGMGGFAGNAGLFATATDVLRLARIYLHSGEGVLDRSLVVSALTNYTAGLDENRGLGWQLRSDKASHASAVLSSSSFGHTGFTGTSVWVDPERDLILVLLTNRVHPTVSHADMQAVRRAFHASVIGSMER